MHATKVGGARSEVDQAGQESPRSYDGTEALAERPNPEARPGSGQESYVGLSAAPLHRMLMAISHDM